MLISDSHKFIFIRMRKVASSSMKAILDPLVIPRPESKIAHLKSRAGLEWNYQKYVCRRHNDIRAAKNRMPQDKFNEYFKFAFVRNPWERLVSEYVFLLRESTHGRHERVKKLGGFNDFIHMQIPRADAYQINMLTSKKGKLLLDFVGKFENLSHDWRFVCEKIGIEYQALPVVNATRHKPYQDYYDDQSRQLVANHWSKEIELFGYTFE